MNSGNIGQKTELVMIIDDSQHSIYQMQDLLKLNNYQTISAESGTEGLQIIKTIRPNLILLDIMMPEMTGVEALEKIRETQNNVELPVIMVTAKDEASDIVQSLRLGANDYITKPVNMDIALARISTQLQMKNLMQESLKTKQVNTINAMVTTLNHEINNPLAIAIGNLAISKDKIDEKRIEKALGALERITSIVKKIEKITDGQIEEVEYSSTVNMFKL